MLRIVTHCFATELPQYATFLQYQLQSLLDFPPQTRVEVAVCFPELDKLTGRVFQDYADKFRIFSDNQLSIVGYYLQPKECLYRAIGRDLASHHQSAEFVWYTDVDHYFGPGCIDSIKPQHIRHGNPSLMFPDKLLIHRNHDIGEDYLRETEYLVEDSKRYGIRKEDFTIKHYNRAIGGVQIVTGDFARKYGYLSGTSWTTPTVASPSQWLTSFRDDIAFRKQACQFTQEEWTPIQLPNLYRLRHKNTSYQEAKV